MAYSRCRLYFVRASTIVSSSLSYISSFLSTGCIILDKIAIGFYILSCSEDRTPFIACSEASVSTWNLPSLLGSTSTD